jgi:signal transduction histidine kinase
VDESGRAIPSRLELTVFRLVQESLNNAAKHAEASRVWVSLENVEAGKELKLTIRDDGRGFVPEDVADGGLGLSQMRERVAAAGGTLQLNSRPGNGTTVIAKLPASVRASEASI